MRERDVTALDLAALCVLTGTLTTVVFYRYGVDNHIAELPILMRAIDPAYLANDFYTNATAGPGPRFLYARFVACFATLETLPYVIFALTWIANVSIAAITAVSARWWFGGSGLAGGSAAALVMSVSTFRLGFAPAIYVSQLLSSRAAAPFALLAIFAALARRPIPAALCAGAAALIHPTFGLETGVIALAICALGEFVHDHDRPAGGSRGISFGAAVALFGGIGVVAAWPELSGERIDGAEFLAIETLFRHPHHSLLSEQATRDVLRAGIFGLGSIVALWLADRVVGVPRTQTVVGLCLAIGLLVGATFGALLFEAIPDRTLALARPLRLLYLLKWWGLVLVGGLLAATWQQRGAARVRIAISLGTAAFLALVARPSAGTALCLGLASAAVLGLWLPRPDGTGRLATRTAALALAAAMLAQLFFGERMLPVSWLERTARLRPALTLDTLPGDEADIARAARSLTPSHAVFVTPPDTGVFRMVAERATVVDFKAFPFGDTAMVEWRERLRRCYGDTSKSGFRASRQLAARYRATAPETLADRGCDYGATFAVIERETKTALPLLAENASYAIVALP